MERRILLATGVSALAAGMAGCAMPIDPPVFDPRIVQQSERMTARQDIAEPSRPLPTTQEDPTGGPGDTAAGTTRPMTGAGPATNPSFGANGEPILRLTLQKVIQRAVVFNHDVKVAGYQPAIDATRVTEAEARFDPVFFSQVQVQRKDEENGGTEFFNPATGTTISSFHDIQEVASGQVGIRQNFESGAQAEFRFDTSYNHLIPQRFTDNPFYQNQITLQVTQPLLRNFGADVNEARIVINRDQARISLLDFRKALEDNISKIEEAYWQLSEAQANVAVEERLLNENLNSYRLELNRINSYLDTRLDTSQVDTEVELRRAALIRARADARNLSDQIKQLMNDPNLPVSSPILIQAADSPVEASMKFDIDDQIASAVENRFELGEQLLKIDTATVTYGVAKNNTLPKLDLVGSVAPEVVKADYEKTLSEETKFGHFDYTLGLQFEFPIGNREALSILRRTELQREQAIEQYAGLVDQVSLDVRQAAREVSTDYDLIVANRNSRFSSQGALNEIIQRQSKGAVPLDPTNIELRLQLTNRVAQAQESENQAIANYNIALERLERAKGTLLRYNDVVMQEDPYRNQGLLR